MPIVAIIPACEGSVSLPNKNIRVIHGKPLIWYVIKTAIACKYIVTYWLLQILQRLFPLHSKWV